MNNRIKYRRRVQRVRKYTMYRNILLSTGGIAVIPLITLCETPYIWFLFPFVLFAFSFSAYIEYVILFHLIHDNDIKFKPFYSWNVDTEDRSYVTSLKKCHRMHTPYSFRLYMTSRR